MMRVIEKAHNYILENWLAVVTGCILTRKGIEIAYTERGYVAIGGEWLIFPMILMLVECFKGVTRFERLEEEDKLDA